MLAGQISERTGSMIKNQNLGAGTDTRFWDAPGLDGALNGALLCLQMPPPVLKPSTL